MGRLANSAPQTDPNGRPLGDPGDTDKYAARLVKYVPAESLAVFLAVNTAIVGWYGFSPDGSAEKNLDGTFYGTVWVTFLLILAATPYYLWRTREPDKPWKVNTVVTTVAFVAWAYSIGGAIFVSTGIYHPLIATLIAPLFTFLVPAFIRPEAVSPPVPTVPAGSVEPAPGG